MGDDKDFLHYEKVIEYVDKDKMINFGLLPFRSLFQNEQTRINDRVWLNYEIEGLRNETKGKYRLILFDAGGLKLKNTFESYEAGDQHINKIDFILSKYMGEKVGITKVNSTLRLLVMQCSDKEYNKILTKMNKIQREKLPNKKLIENDELIIKKIYKEIMSNINYIKCTNEEDIKDLANKMYQEVSKKNKYSFTYSAVTYNAKKDDIKKKLDEAFMNLKKEDSKNIRLYKISERNCIIVLKPNEDNKYILNFDRDKQLKNSDKYDRDKIGVLYMSETKRRHVSYNTLDMMDYEEKLDIIQAIRNQDYDCLNEYTLEKLKNIYKGLYKDVLMDKLSGYTFYRKTITNYIMRLKENEDRYVINIDINYLRRINLLMGEDKGDKVLTDFMELCLEVYNKDNEVLIRNGGDEFLIITDDKNKINKLNDKIKYYNEGINNKNKEFKSIKEQYPIIQIAYAQAKNDFKINFREFKQYLDDEMSKNKLLKKQNDPDVYFVKSIENPDKILGILTNGRDLLMLDKPTSEKNIPEAITILNKQLIESKSTIIKELNNGEQYNKLDDLFS